MDAKQQTLRKTILIASGLILGATTTSLLMHQQRPTDGRAPTGSEASTISSRAKTPAHTLNVVQALAPSTSPQAKTSDAVDNSGLSVSARTAASSGQATATNTTNGFPATEISDAAAQARSEAGKQNPMSPVGSESNMRSTPARHAISQHRGNSSGFRRTHIPPPPETALWAPPTPSIAEASHSADPYIRGRGRGINIDPAPDQNDQNSLTSRDVKLVGLLDNKAIFRIQTDKANHLNIPYSFILGTGQEYKGFKLVAVTTRSATLRDDAHKLCTKELQAIR